MATRNAAPGETIRNFDGSPVDVQAPCRPDAAGHHYCSTHRESFTSNLGVNLHVDDGKKHVLAWWCFEHGPEAP